MLNQKKVVFVAPNSDVAHDLKNYEAIKLITHSQEVEPVWACNKTPVILEENADDVKKQYPYLKLPNYIFDQDHFIHFCHDNGIECGEYRSGTKHNTAEDHCFLCAVALHHDANGNPYPSLADFNRFTPEVNDIIIYESDNFYVKIEYGCLIKGMVMICPKEHILSAARIPNNQVAEYMQVMRDVEFLLKAVYGDEPVIFFEHGSDPSGFSSHKRSIVHAHTHVAWGVKFKQKYLDMVCLKPVSSLKVLYNTKYMSYQEGCDGELLAVSDPEVCVQRQYPRQVIGEMLGIPNELTNWRKEAFMDNIIGTFDDIYSYIVSNRKFLCDRIIQATEGFIAGYPLRNEANV